jgi:hypothetical protein
MTDMLFERMRDIDGTHQMKDADLEALFPEQVLWGRVATIRATGSAAPARRLGVGDAVRSRTAVVVGAIALAGGAVGALVVGVTSAGQEHGLTVSRTATEACQALNAPYGGTLTGAYPSTAGQVVTWDEARITPGSPGSAYNDWPSSEDVSVCVYQGTFSGFPGPPGAPSTYDTVVVVVGTQGQAVLDFAGPVMSFSPPPPPPQG